MLIGDTLSFNNPILFIKSISNNKNINIIKLYCKLDYEKSIFQATEAKLNRHTTRVFKHNRNSITYL